MTKNAAAKRCGWCGRDIPAQEGRGRPRLYCRDVCRQRAYELRRRRQEGSLADDEIAISVTQWRRAQDGLFELTAALEDVDHDLNAEEPVTHEEAFRHLYDVANRLRGLELAGGSRIKD